MRAIRAVGCALPLFLMAFLGGGCANSHNAGVVVDHDDAASDAASSTRDAGTSNVDPGGKDGASVVLDAGPDEVDAAWPAPQVWPRNGTCGVDTYEFRSHCYAVVQPMSWSTARDLCKSFHPGNGHLVTIESPAEQQFLIDISETNYTVSGGPYWIDLEIPSQGAPSVWDTGTPLTFSNWELGQPSAIASAATLMRDDGHWRAEQESSGYPAICEVE